MGYSTQFKGTLSFTEEVTGPQLARLGEILGEDRRDHAEWNVPGDTFWCHVDLEVTSDFTGIRWNDSEKTHGMDELVRLVIRLMRERWPDFGLSGRMDAQGDELGDVWALTVEGGSVTKIKYALVGREVECPECEARFVLDGELVETPA